MTDSGGIEESGWRRWVVGAELFAGRGGAKAEMSCEWAESAKETIVAGWGPEEVIHALDRRCGARQRRRSAQLRLQRRKPLPSQQLFFSDRFNPSNRDFSLISFPPTPSMRKTARLRNPESRRVTIFKVLIPSKQVTVTRTAPDPKNPLSANP